MPRKTPKHLSSNGDLSRKCPLCGGPMKVLANNVGSKPVQDIVKKWQCDSCRKQFTFG